MPLHGSSKPVLSGGWTARGSIPPWSSKLYREILPEELKVDKTLGYVYFIDKKHPLAHKSVGKVYYHRHVCSIILGRWLTDSEVVHHKDHDRTNNSLTNLEVLSHSEHARLHSQVLEETLCKQCKVIFLPKKSTQIFCSPICYSNSRITKNISSEDIVYWVSNYSWLRASKELGLSDNGLRKRYKSLTGLDPKSIKKIKK
jgi:hypothetical protein